MSPYARYLPPPPPLPMAPAPSQALPARLVPTSHGGAIVTIGGITSPYANAEMARDALRAMAARGLVNFKEAPSC